MGQDMAQWAEREGREQNARYAEWAARVAEAMRRMRDAGDIGEVLGGLLAEYEAGCVGRDEGRRVAGERVE